MDLLARLGLDLSKVGFDLKGLATSAAGQGGWIAIVKLGAELIIIMYAAFWLWSRIRGTQAERLVKGVMVLLFICIASWLAGFTLITAILQQLIPVFVLALLIIFQPEIRRGLGYLGRGTTFKMDLSLADSQRERQRVAMLQLISAIRELARLKIGALIVVEPLEGERDYLSPGITVNADVSSTLLLSIFMPSSPLHDGAVIIRKDKIVAAGVILPMTDNPKLSHKYGTRHRAAIGLSEIYDGLCVVVSEETGAISAASRGMLVRYGTADELADPLSYMYDQGTDTPTATPLHSFLTLFSRAKRKERDSGSRSAREAPLEVPPLPPPPKGESAYPSEPPAQESVELP